MTAGTRRPFEVAVAVHRASPRGPEFLVLLRSAERHGYWNLVAGGVGWDEDGATAAARELREETGLVAPVVDLGFDRSYDLAGEPEELRVRFPAGTERVVLGLFRAEAPPGWEPVLNDEHVDHRWCTLGEALELLRWPEPRAAVQAAHDTLEGAA